MKKKRYNMKFVLLFLIIGIILISGLFLFPTGRIPILGKSINKPVIEEVIPLFEVDQILIKTMLKEGERMARQMNIMDISEKGLLIELEPRHLFDIVSLSDNNFVLNPGQTKIIYINLSTYNGENKTKYEPGIYVGGILIESDSYKKKIPVVVEIETREVLFDVNVQSPIGQKYVKRGDYLETQIQVFNLKKIGLTEVDMNYFVKDIFGNSIITENEDVMVETKASLSKTVHIPENLNPGEYIFGVTARYGSSVGTSTSLFEVISPVEEEMELLSYYKNNKLPFFILGIILAITISGIGLYTAFCVGRYFHNRVNHIIKNKSQRLKSFKKSDRIRKIIVPVMLLIVLLISFLSILIELGMLSTEQLSLGNVILNIKSTPRTLSYFTSQYYLYIAIATLVIGAISIYYIEKREKEKR